jgi:hypothetical protein
MRTGLVVGFAVGYYLGAKAGRERYEQLRDVLDRLAPVEKVRAAVELGLERLREVAEPESATYETVIPPSSN